VKLNQVKHLKSLQKENAQLKKLVADLSLDNSVLKEENLKGQTPFLEKTQIPQSVKW